MARVAILLDEMFEDSEFRVPYERLREAGHQVVVVGAEAGKELKGKKGKETVKADAGIHQVSAEEFDGVVIRAPFGICQVNVSGCSAMRTLNFCGLVWWALPSVMRTFPRDLCMSRHQPNVFVRENRINPVRRTWPCAAASYVVTFRSPPRIPRGRSALADSATK